MPTASDNRNLISAIFEHMRTDDECPLKQSQYLISIYESTDIKGQQLIDDALICICGYSLSTIIENGQS